MSAEYSEARERYEITAVAADVRRKAFATPNASELTESKSARAALKLATQRLYDFLATSDLDDSDPQP